jgi:hypothetical protein
MKLPQIQKLRAKENIEQGLTNPARLGSEAK